MRDCGCNKGRKTPPLKGDVIEDARSSFEQQARDFLENVATLEEGDRRDAIDAEIERYEQHRYLFVSGKALQVLRAAR